MFTGHTQTGDRLGLGHGAELASAVGQDFMWLCFLPLFYYLGAFQVWWREVGGTQILPPRDCRLALRWQGQENSFPIFQIQYIIAWDCHTKDHVGWFKQQKFIVSQVWRLEV